MSLPQPVELYGTRFAALTREALVDHVFDALGRGRGGWIVTANVDHLRRYAGDPELRELVSGAELVVADGVPLLWAARLQGTPLPDRIAGSDLVGLLARRAAREERAIHLLGGAPGAAQGAADALRAGAPGLRISGAEGPVLSAPPTEAELAPLRESLRRARPDLVYVALGAPKQERVIAALRPVLPAAWWVGVGISLSFLAGDVSRAPLWMQRSGLEWLHRLSQEPGRLARRYLIDDLPFALALLARSWRRRA